MEKTIYVGLGSNLGNREAFLLQALENLKTLAINGSWKVSSNYETAPVDASGDKYLNVVCSFKTTLAAEALHQVLNDLEQAAGRKRLAYNSPRTLDLDLLFYDSDVIDTPHLKVPHPRLHRRAFVLIPLCEIDPDWVHPKLNKNVKQLLLELANFEIKGVERHESSSYCQETSSHT